MYYSPYSFYRSDEGNQDNNMNISNNIMENENMLSYIRLLHAAPKAPAVDVYVNDNLLVKNFNYRQFTDYVKIPSGTYNVKVYTSGVKEEPIIETDLFVPPRSVITIAAIRDTNNEVVLYPIAEVPIENATVGKTRVRVVHLIPNAPAVDIALPNGTVIYEDVEFKDIEKYIEVLPGNYTFEVRLAGTEIPILYIPNIRLRANRYYTVYAVGLIGEEPSPQVLIPLDGITYIKI